MDAQPDMTYSDALDAAYRRMSRGEMDRVLYAMYLDGRTTAEEYIAYLRADLHDAWQRIAELEDGWPE